MIVVTTPTGTIGGHVLQSFLDRGAPVRVIARDPACLPAQAKGRVDLVRGSHGDPGVVTEAFAGADTVFWLVPPDYRTVSIEASYVDFTRPACEAIVGQGVRRVVVVSALGRGSAVAQNAGVVTASLAMRDLIAKTGVNYRALTPSSFMTNLLTQVEPIKHQGTFFDVPAADRKLPTVAPEDIAAVAVDLLLDDSWTGQDDVRSRGRRFKSCPRYESWALPSAHTADGGASSHAGRGLRMLAGGRAPRTPHGVAVALGGLPRR